MPRARARAIELEVTLRSIYPRIWRRVLVPAASTLDDLHRVLQIAFDWRDERHHRFTLGARTFEADDEDGVTLASHVRAKTRLSYEYDFGASWQHDIVVARVDVEPPEGATLPVCVAGERAAPPEDTGGPWGYMAVLEALADPRHPDHDDHLSWMGLGWDAEHVDLDAVNARLAARFAPRKASAAKRKASGATSAAPPVLSTPLSDDETELLAEMLTTCSEFDASGLLGLLHAVVVGPSELEPHVWIELAFPRGLGVRSVAETQLRLALLLRHHHEVATALAAGRVIAPAPDEVLACRSFASGYVAGASLDAVWWAEPSLRIFLVHLAYLARRFDVVPARARAKLEAEGDPDARICEMLGGIVSGAYDTLHASRHAVAPATFAKPSAPRL